MVGERQVANRLVAQGLAPEELQLGDLDEPLVYDLFGVDEHMGGLGGGHYRAFALNHLTDKWYHFDDSHVEAARPKDAVVSSSFYVLSDVTLTVGFQNSNAYLLFYRRRSATPLGGKTHDKIEEARLKSKTHEDMTIDTQLPTPPSEQESGFAGSGLSRLSALSKFTGPRDDHWIAPRYTTNSSAPTPPSEDPPAFDVSQTDELISDSDIVLITTDHFEFPDPSADPSARNSPSSSNEAEIDSDDYEIRRSFSVGVNEASRSNSPDWQSGIPSPTSSLSDHINPFGDVNLQKSKRPVSFKLEFFPN